MSKLMKLFLMMFLLAGVIFSGAGCETTDDDEDDTGYVSAWSGNSITEDQAQGHYINIQNGGRLYFANSLELYAFIDKYTDGETRQSTAGTGYYVVSTTQANETPLSG